nr:nitroreductase family protein [Candidatus Njordarchaeota archaeon]
MDLFETIKNRRSVRSYKDKEVEDEKLQKILEAGNAAPSAGDLQAYEIVVVRKQEQKEALSKAALGEDFIAEAPVVLVIVANQKRSAQRYGKRGAELYAVQDATIAASYVQLAATALGLSTCWVGAYNDAAVAKVVGANMSEGLIPEAILPIGYANESPRATPRRKLSEIVHQGKL